MPVKVLITGNKTATGIATADQDIVPLFSVDDADLYLGPGSEGAVQAYAALAIDGVTLYAAPVAEAAGGVAATLTVTFGGTWSTGGTVLLHVAGKTYPVNILPADTTTNAAASASTALNSDPRAPFTSAPSVAVVTITVRSKGTRGNDYVAWADMTQAPAGLTVALAGGTALTNGMTPFSGGTGSDNVTNVLALLTNDTYDIQAWAQNDATNAALIKAQLDSEAGPLVQHTEHAIFAKNRAQATAITFAQTTLNHYRSTVVQFLNCETSTAFIAAQVAALRATAIADNPNTNFAGTVCPTIPLQSFWRVDAPKRSALKAMLNAGVTPLITNADGTVTIVRGIQSHSLSGSTPDYRTLDWADVDVPDRISKEVGALWQARAKVNPYVGADPAPGERVPEGVMTPTNWNSDVHSLLKDKESINWIQDVDSNMPVSEYNTDAARIMSAIPVVVRKKNYQLGASIRQTA